MENFEVRLRTYLVFACKKKGQVSVFDDKIGSLPAKNIHTTSHNVLSGSDLEKWFSSPSLSKQTPRRFQAQLVFSTGILHAMRATVLRYLSVKQFEMTKIWEQLVWKITRAVGRLNGSSKTQSGGWRSVGQKPREICIWDDSYYQRKLKIFKDIEEKMDIRKSIPTVSDRFSLEINVSAADRHKFLNVNIWDEIHSWLLSKMPALWEMSKGRAQKIGRVLTDC